jgi:ABC-type iron transport system FetAB ATPase subunit
MICMVAWLQKRSHHTDPESTPLVRISARFKLGGFFQLKGPTEEDADILLRLVAGVDITQTKDSGSIYVPPFLMYTYVSDSPVLLEGSILKNLLLSVSSEDRESGDEPSAEQAWQIAQRCGLDKEYLHAPESFNIGKAGRNIPVTARQVICIARAILSDACVLMLHKPTALLTPSHSEQIFTVLKEYCDHGGLHGVLDPDSKHRELLGSKPRDFLTGHAVRTVIITRPHDAPAPRQVQRIVRFAAKWEETSGHELRHLATSTMGNKIWEGESKNTATNILIRTRSIQGCTSPTKEGMVRKRGQYNTAYKDRFLACVNGSLFYYDSEQAYFKGAKVGCVWWRIYVCHSDMLWRVLY